MTINRRHLACLLDEDWNHEHISIAPVNLNESGHYQNAQTNKLAFNEFHEHISKKMLFYSCSGFDQTAMHREKLDPLLLEELLGRLGAVEVTVGEIKNIVNLVVCNLNDRIFELECLQDDQSSCGTARCNFSIDEDD